LRRELAGLVALLDGVDRELFQIDLRPGSRGGYRREERRFDNIAAVHSGFQ